MPYINVLQDLTAGPYGWVDSGLVPTGAAALLDKPFIYEDLAASDITFVPPLAATVVARTAVFTAPEDCTVRNLVFTPTVADSSGNFVLISENAFKLIIGTVTIAGTGPDAGSRIEGFGIPCGLFTLPNLLRAPRLNWKLDAGDTITLTFHFIGGGSRGVPYHAGFTYDPGQDNNDPPAQFIGSTTAPGAAAAIPTTASTGTITVTASPTTPGDQITLQGWGGPTTTAGGVLTGSAGGGGSGTNTWDTNVTGVTNIRDAILAALQDNSNDFAAFYTFASSGIDAIDVTRQFTGPIGNLDEFTTTSGSLSLTGSGNLTGGAGGTANIAFQAPSAPVTVEAVYVQSVSNGIFPTVILASFPSAFEALNIGGSPSSEFAPFILPSDQNVTGYSEGSASVPASTSVDIDVKHSFNTGIVYTAILGRV